MSMDATVQIRMDSQLKAQVEELYREMGTSFAEAVRIFAQQSMREGGMPFRPRMMPFEEMPQAAIDEKLTRSMADIVAGQVLSQADLDAQMKEKIERKRNFDSSRQFREVK